MTGSASTTAPVTGASPGRGRWGGHALSAVILCAITALTFSQVNTFGFAPFDDDVELMYNEHIQSFSCENLVWMLTDTARTQRYIPLSWLAWACLIKAAGNSPMAFHVYGFLLHMLNVVLVYFLVFAFIRRLPALRSVQPTHACVCALLASALWAVHPMRVEVVAWATQARYSEALACLIGSVLLYLSALERNPQGMWRCPAYWGAVVCYGASVLFYPSAICVPLLLPVISLVVASPCLEGGSRWRRLRGLLIAIAPFLLLALVVGLVTIYGRHNAHGIWVKPVVLSEFGVVERVVQAAAVTSFYLWKPFDLGHLSPIYPHLVDYDPLSFVCIANLLMTMLLSAVALAVWRRFPALALLWFAHVLTMLPFGGYFERPHLLGDRYSYAQSVVFAVAVGAALAWLQPRVAPFVQGAVATVCAFLVLVLGTWASAQSMIWRDAETVMRVTILELGSSSFARELHWQLGRIYVFQGRFVEAIEQCDRTLRERPDDGNAKAVKANALLGLARQETGDAARGLYLEAGRIAEQVSGASSQGPNRLAAALLFLWGGDFEHARRLFEKGLELDPADADMRFGLAQVLLAQGLRPEALQQFDLAVAANPALASQRDQILQLSDAKLPVASPR